MFIATISKTKIKYVPNIQENIIKRKSQNRVPVGTWVSHIHTNVSKFLFTSKAPTDMFKNVLKVSLGDIIAGAADYALARAAVDETGRLFPNNWKQINEQTASNFYTHVETFPKFNIPFHFTSPSQVHMFPKFTIHHSKFNKFLILHPRTPINIG